jgi:flagellin
VLDDATTAFAEARGTVGAYQRYNVRSRLSSVAAEREALTAAHSRIVDADFAEETSNLARAQVQTAASVKVLQIANQNAATVLALLS